MNVIHQAIKMGRPDTLPSIIRAALDCGIDINALNEDNKTPLHVACSRADFRSIEILLKHNANPNAHDGSLNGETPLHAACYNGDIKCIKLLTENGADVNARSLRYGELPIHSCYHGIAVNRFIAIRHLIEAGSEINAVDRHQQTPLHYECNDDDTDLIRILLSKGANIEARDVNKKTPLLLALEARQDITARLLMQAGASIHAKDIHGNSPLVFCIQRGDPELFEYMLETCTQKPMKADLGYPLIDEVLSKRGKGVDDAQMVIKIMEYMGEKVDYKINGKSIVGRFSTQKARDLIKQAIRQERSEKLAGSITDAMGDPASEDEPERPRRSASAGLSL